MVEKACWQSVAPELDPGCGTVGTKLELADAVEGKGPVFFNFDSEPLKTRNLQQNSFSYGIIFCGGNSMDNDIEKLIEEFDNKIAKYYNIEDLYQSGMIGLIKAYKKYDKSGC